MRRLFDPDWVHKAWQARAALGPSCTGLLGDSYNIMAYPAKAPGTHLGRRSQKQIERDFERSSSASGVSDGFISKAPSQRGDIPIPDADPHWKPTARSWFNSLKLSGQSEFYEASDWATAVAAAQAYDVFLRTYNASIFAQFVRLSERLGCTISDRKRSRIELGEPEPTDEDEDVADETVQGWHGRLVALEGGKQ